MERKVNKLHLIYCLVISLLLIIFIIICWVLSSKNVISEYAFENFSFAATIASILLAVVSIVYTIYSGAETSSSIGVLKNVENNISKQIETLQGIESVIKESIGEGNTQMEETLKSQMKQLFAPQENIERVKRYSDSNQIFDIQRNPPLGNVFLYCCLLSNEYNKPWNLDMPGKYLNLYFAGYVAALRSVSVLGFTYKLDKDTNMLSQCKFADNIVNAITLENLKKVLQEQSKEYPEFVDIISQVEAYFGIKE